MEKVAIREVKMKNEIYYKISNCHLMRPFFMSIVSDSDHWMFISSNGGLTAGRKNAQYALFPYYTDDKITELSETTGSKTIVRVKKKDSEVVWEPFSDRTTAIFKIHRNLYKNQYGNKVIFEEINEDLRLSFRYEWNSSNLYGFARRSKIANLSDENLSVSIIDGIQNVLPHGVPSDLQNSASNLVDAYKRTQIHPQTGIGIFALSAIIVDKAEPSEALKANVVWSKGLENSNVLLSSLQLNSFRNGIALTNENDIKGEKGAYLLNSEFELRSLDEKDWILVANVNQSHSKIAKLIQSIDAKELSTESVFEDVELGTSNLIALNASADGIQCTEDSFKDTRHFANVLFNNMRGGIFDENYKIERQDFEKYLAKANKELHRKAAPDLAELPTIFTLQHLKKWLSDSDEIDLKRLSTEYLPLKFSRRHGDPSRPWNRFSINMVDEADGSKILDYEGNWRDIFQNWEAMVHSFPDFIDGMIFRFLNASTFDGYNPYRITKDGFDWEVIEPDDPWSYIGYWGDHQIIYLLKFLEFSEKLNPGKLARFFDQELFVYANVPYKIKSYAQILKDPKDTIVFDESADKNIRAQMEQIGADGSLLRDQKGGLHQVNLMEKILATLLAKLSNYVPDGGIWMNTQRPEWNDANNALVGNGVSMVTLYYLRRFLDFLSSFLESATAEETQISSELAHFYSNVKLVFENQDRIAAVRMGNMVRKEIMDKLGQSASNYRNNIYTNSFTGKKEVISISDLKEFISDTTKHIDRTIKANKRSDGLYHAYNLLTVESDKAFIEYLNEMLEGQVAVLSSGFLNSEESLEVLDALKESALFRQDQYSYILYPNKELPGFLEKNTIPPSSLSNSELLKRLEAEGNNRIVERDVFGKLHFNGNFRNAKDLEKALIQLDSEKYGALVKKESELLLNVFESIFNHQSFTGRSGTFYGYEGLGSIYWHMVSKLLLAVQECCLIAIRNNEDERIIGGLLAHFYEINEGIGVHKSPELYGAFPTDPYSHTPAHRGAQQPGMTGQVKEDVLTRFGELGAFVKDGKLFFYPCMLRKTEFLKEEKTFEYLDVDGQSQNLRLKEGSLAFTYCQIPVVYELSDKDGLMLTYKNGSTSNIPGLSLDQQQSRMVFERTGEIQKIQVNIERSVLK